MHSTVLFERFDLRSKLRGARSLIGVVGLSLLLGCATPPTTTAPTLAQIEQQQRIERANGYLNTGLTLYETGNFDDAMKALLQALDSGQLTPPQALSARKHVAFIHCLGNRETDCRDEFTKAFALDGKFDLSPAEAGHPQWGGVFKAARAEFEARRGGSWFSATPSVNVVNVGEKLLAEAMVAYEAAEFSKAIKAFLDALKETLSRDDQIKARKFAAFGYCLTNRAALCRAEFEKLLTLKPDFELAPAEAGHPSWGPSFRAVKLRRPSAPPRK